MRGVNHPDPEVQRLREEVEKLERVVTEVMGTEFDSIMARQSDDQRAAMQWMATSMAMMLATVRLLVDHGLLEQEEVLGRVQVIRRRLLAHVEAMGSDADVADLFGSVLTADGSPSAGSPADGSPADGSPVPGGRPPTARKRPSP
jgi:hypothetical protein